MLFQDKWAAKHLAAQSFRMHGVPPGAPELRGNLYGSFAFRYVARAQALFPLLVYMRLLPTVSPKNRATATDVSARRKQMAQGSAPSGTYETPQSFGPRGRNSIGTLTGPDRECRRVARVETMSSFRGIRARFR